MTTGSTASGAEHGSALERQPSPWRALSTDEIVSVLDRLTDGILVLGLEGHIQYVSE